MFHIVTTDPSIDYFGGIERCAKSTNNLRVFRNNDLSSYFSGKMNANTFVQSHSAGKEYISNRGHIVSR